MLSHSSHEGTIAYLLWLGRKWNSWEMSNQTHREGSFSDQNTSEREWLSWNEMKCCGWEDNRCDLFTIYIYMLLRFSKTLKFWSSKANWHLHFSLPSIILADLLGNRTLLKRVQRVMVCDLWMVDFDPICVFLCFKVCCLWL